LHEVFLAITSCLSTSTTVGINNVIHNKKITQICQAGKGAEEVQFERNSWMRPKMGVSPNPERESKARHVLRGHPWSYRHTTPQRLTPHAM